MLRFRPVSPWEDLTIMIEIGLGLLAIVSAAAIALGLSDGLIPFPLGHGAIIAISLTGVAFCAAGSYRLLLKRTDDRYLVRTTGLAILVAGITCAAALAMPALSETLSLISFLGFPLGLYLMGQGILILFVVMLFVFALRQGAIDTTSRP